MKKKIVPILIITVLAVSLGLNAWNYGYKVAYARGFNDGVQTVSNSVMAQYNETGKIQIQMEDKVVAFAPETSTPITGDIDEMFR